MTVEEAIKYDGRFTVAEWGGGIAFYCDGPEMVADEDTEWTGYKVPTGMVVMVMVGDDREHIVDPDDLIPLDDDAYCHECGQVGCTADGR